MAELTGSATVFATNTSAHDTTKKHTLGTRARDASGNEYIYLLGVASTGLGSWVTYNESFATALVTANAIGPVAIAMAAIVALEYGWYQIDGINVSAKTDTVAADKPLYIDGTDGRADDAVVTGDLIVGAISQTLDTTNVATVWISHPFVTDTLG